MTKGRPKTFHRDVLYERVSTLQSIFAWAISKADWVRMNRPMERPLDTEEEKERRREYSELLQSLPYSELGRRCDPKDDSSYPALIIDWQYEQGFLRKMPLDAGSASNADFRKLATKIFERQSEYARSLAFYLVSKDAKISLEYLRKICRKWERLPDLELKENEDLTID